MDTGVLTGTEVTVDFGQLFIVGDFDPKLIHCADPMLAKLIVWAPTRPQAIEKMKQMLKSTVALGVTTNQPFLLNCLSAPSFLDGTYTTSLIPLQISLLLEPTLSALAKSGGGLETKFALIASIFLRTIKEEDKRNLGSIPSDWSAINRQDLSRLPLEAFDVLLPDGKTSQLKLELPIPPAIAPIPFNSRGTTYDYRTWKSPPIVPADKSKGAGAAKAALVDNFYRGIASRDGTEGREKGDWKLGVGEEEISAVQVNVAKVRFSAEQRKGRTCEFVTPLVEKCAHRGFADHRVSRICSSVRSSFEWRRAREDFLRRYGRRRRSSRRSADRFRPLSRIGLLDSNCQSPPSSPSFLPPC